MTVNTLTGFAGYFKKCNEDFEKDGPVVLVEGHLLVTLYSGLVGSFLQRMKFLVAKVERCPFLFGNFYPLEDFNIALQTQFVDSEDVAKVLRLVGNIEDSDVRRYSDDGVTQGVTAKVGIARVENVQVPRVVKLAPYRTFLEVDQPKSPFVLRMKPGKDGSSPTAALFEADGGRWRLEAIKNVEKWLKKEIPKAIVLA
jgi:hypothetical protein